MPLWISNEKIPHELPECKACGAPCVVELQLMPTIVYVLKPYNHTHVAGGCWKDGGCEGFWGLGYKQRHGWRMHPLEGKVKMGGVEGATLLFRWKAWAHSHLGCSGCTAGPVPGTVVWSAITSL